jgi:methionine synthase II (cobalamin-independent)
MLETTIAGSLPKPAWLPKPRMLWAPWQFEGEALVEAKRDAALLALKEQEDAGIDIVTDGGFAQPSRKRFTVRRILGAADLWITEFVITYDARPSCTVSIMEFRDGKVARETQYFGDPLSRGLRALNGSSGCAET